MTLWLQEIVGVVHRMTGSIGSQDRTSQRDVSTNFGIRLNRTRRAHSGTGLPSAASRIEETRFLNLALGWTGLGSSGRARAWAVSALPQGGLQSRIEHPQLLGRGLFAVGCGVALWLFRAFDLLLPSHKGSSLFDRPTLFVVDTMPVELVPEVVELPLLDEPTARIAVMIFRVCARASLR